MTRPIAALDVTPEQLRQRIVAAQFEQAAERTNSASDQIAYRLDAWLVTHPEVCSTAADYPGWAEQFAAIKAAHSSTAPKEATA